MSIEPAFEAGGPSPSPAVKPPLTPQTRRSKWPRRLLLAMLLGLAMLAGIALLAGNLQFGAPVHVIIDGEEIVHGFDLASLPPAHKVVFAAVVVVALLSAMVIVPLALVFGLAAILGLVLLIVGIPLVAVLSGLLLLLSPFVLMGWLLWKLIAS